MRKLFIPLVIISVVAIVGVFGCAPAPAPPAAPPTPPPPGPPVAPAVTLNRLEVTHMEALGKDYLEGGFGDHLSPRVYFFILAAVLDIENPNDYPIMLDEIRCTFALKGGPGDEPHDWFELNSPFSYDDQWIPAKMTNQARLESIFTTRGVGLSLAVAQGWKVDKLETTYFDLIKTWWAGIGGFEFPVKVIGTAKFTSPYGDAVTGFSEVFP